MRSFFLSLFLVLTGLGLNSQDNYFQQEVNYTIDVELDDVNHVLHGSETFEYINNSPSTLDFIYIHLWPNAYKNGETALSKQLLRDNNYVLYHAKEKIKGWIDSLDFKIDGQNAQWDFDPEHIDIAKLKLNNPLPPGQSIVVSTPFRVKIPSGLISRLGHVGESYQITQWYPKPAVYDNEGWHPMPYLTQGEFYSEFGSFDVSITLPKNYVLGATGDRVNAEDEEKFIEEKIRFTEAYLENPDAEEYAEINQNKFPDSSTEMKTVRFKQEKVHDFAWFADKRYMVLKGEVELPKSKRKVDTYAMFTTGEADLWAKSIEYLNDATYYYSLWNGEYAYNHVTAVDGTISAGGGMEYPNITVIGRSGTAQQLEVVIMHEVGHNWFYGMLGSNERVHAWMDEGMNSFTESRYMERKYPEQSGFSMFLGENVAEKINSDKTYGDMDELAYLFTARYNADQPMEIHSNDYTSLNYGTIVYKKSAFVFHYLLNYLGEDKFNQCMQTYFDEWSFKHPKPKNIKEVFERVSGENLDWFFEDIVKTSKKIDFKISSVKKTEDGKREIKVTNAGQIAAPVVIQSIESGENKIKDEKWLKNIAPGDSQTLVLSADKEDMITIDYNEIMPEINRQNNHSKAKGLLKKMEPLSLKLMTGLDDGSKTQLFWLPLYAWNAYDKNMLGLHIHNKTLPGRKFEYSVSPLYSFVTKDINGFANFAVYNKKTDVKLAIQSFSDYNNSLLHQQYIRVNPSVDIRLKGQPRDRKKRVISLASNFIFLDKSLSDEVEIDAPDPKDEYYFVNSASYKQSYENIRSGYNFSLEGRQIIEEWGNVLYPVSANIDYFYKNKKGKSKLFVRAFAGKFIEFSNNNTFGWNSGGQTGLTDFEYDELYLGRTETDGLLSRQTTLNQGGLLKPFGVASNDWMLSALGRYDIPKIPLFFFAGASYSNVRDFQVVNGVVTEDLFNTWTVDYSVGLRFDLDFFAINFPLLYPELFNDAEIGIGEAINFELNLNLKNPFDILRANIK